VRYDRPALTWVLGAGGLLGAHVAASVGRSDDATLWRPSHQQFAWSEPRTLKSQISTALEDFVPAASRFGEWRIIWCAGAGVIGTSAAVLADETATLREFLVQLGVRLRSATLSRGSIFLSSSAGGVWAGNPQRPLTEASSPAPISDYGCAKLEQEETLLAWAQDHPTVATLVGRITNLYGPGQNLEKAQGLISHLCRCLLQNRPAHIYVPLDTIRDFLFVEDCAELIGRCLARLSSEARSGRPVRVLKILAAEKATSIAAVLGMFERIAKRHPRLVVASSPARYQQATQMFFRSCVWPDSALDRTTPLPAGIDRVYRHQLRQLQAGKRLAAGASAARRASGSLNSQVVSAAGTDSRSVGGAHPRARAM
jgi:UDP-glucose 4-epimerase